MLKLRLTFSEGHQVYNRRDTYRNNGTIRHFVQKNLKRTLDRNDIFSVKLRYSRREEQHELLKLSQLLDEHGASGIICEGTITNYLFFVPHYSKGLNNNSFYAILANATHQSNCGACFVVYSGSGCHRFMSRYNVTRQAKAPPCNSRLAFSQQLEVALRW